MQGKRIQYFIAVLALLGVFVWKGLGESESSELHRLVCGDAVPAFCAFSEGCGENAVEAFSRSYAVLCHEEN